MTKKDDAIVYQTNIDTTGDIYGSKPVTINFEPYDIHAMVSGAFPIEENYKKLIKVLNSYDLSFDRVSAFKKEVIDNSIDSIDSHINKIITSVLLSYNLSFRISTFEEVIPDPYSEVFKNTDDEIKKVAIKVLQSYTLPFNQISAKEKISSDYSIDSVDSHIKKIITSVLLSYEIPLKQISTFEELVISDRVFHNTDDEIKKVAIKVLQSYDLIFKQIFTFQAGRLNSNIYKNIFAETVTDVDYISQIKDSIRTSEQDIIQENHGFDLYDAVYLDSNNQYQKGLAENTEKALIKGIVTRITNKNIFTLMDVGKSDYIHLDYQDTSFLYLSDKIPGKLVHYTEITNTVYVPLAVYANDSIIINLQQGSAGDTMIPYVPPESLFDEYTQEELNNTIGQIILAV